ncbi:MAG: hypothetical protein EBV09_02635 [Actinobacteria bacterium]|nr:hypothetical protein [Actinomycetota bacterium]
MKLHVSKRIIGFCVALLTSASITSSPFATADQDPFPGLADGAEVSQRQPINPSTGNPADGSAPIECPSGSGRSQVANATTKEQYLVCVKNWRPTSSVNADREFSERQEAARAAAQAESQAWNAANPGKQKCVQWGPIVHANGVSTASGGVCANPVQPGASTTVASQEAPSVQAPNSSGTSSGGSSTISDTSTAASSSPSTSVGSSSTNSSTTSSQTSPNPAAPAEDFSKLGSGTPYTRVLKGQLSTSDCPAGFQAANGVIAAIGLGTFTECWPENAWSAYRLGGTAWEQFKNSGGTYDARAEMDRRNRVTELKALAKSVAQTAADQTPGIQRCSRWTGYGESGQECAYTFVKPDPSVSTTSSTSVGGLETRTATSSTASSETSTGTTSTPGAVSQGSTPTNSNDPFPNLQNGDEIPNTRIVSPSGMKQSDWEQSFSYKALTCPAGSGRASGVDLNFTVSQSDDRWFAYCVKYFQQSTPITQSSETTTAGSTSPNNSSTNSGSDSTTATSNQSSSSVSSNSNSSSNTIPTNSNQAPTLQSTAVKVSGSVDDLRDLASAIVENSTEKKRLQGLLNRVEGVSSVTSLKSVKLPGSSFFEESAVSKTPDLCTVSGVTINSLKKGICLVSYTIVDSNGNHFTTDKEIFFRK